MALTRPLLKAMGIDDDKVDQIISAHTETVNALKEQRDQYKADAEKLPKVQKQLDDLKAAADDGGYEAKYNAEHKAFEDYKAQVAAEKVTAEKTGLYRQLLLDTGIPKKQADAIIRITDMNSVTVKDGKLDNKDQLTEGIKSEWGSFIVQQKTDPAKVDTPPADGGDGGEDDLGNLSMEEYIAARKKM